MKAELKEALSDGMARILKIFKDPEIARRKEIARQLAENKLKEIMSGDKVRILKIFYDPEFEFPVHDGFEYQVLICASHDHEKKELIRVEVIVTVGPRWEHTEYDFIAVAELKALNTKAER